MASQIKIKRSSVSGKVPTTSDIAAGELAINTRDRKIYSSNGTTVFNFGAEYLQVANAVSNYLPISNPVATGTLSAPLISVTQSAYNEGGQIDLAIPSSGSTLNGTVAIDVYQNKFRIFETGGSNRGAYIDLTSASTGVGSNLLAGGGSINLSPYLEVANAVATYATKAYAAANTYVKSILANTNSYISNKVDTTTFNTVLANTNSYIATKSNWTALTSTNTALRTLISDRIQVANAVATYQTKAVERAALANTNAYIATKASWSALTSTNTAIRSYVDTSVAAVVNSAPGTLNTLYELAAALANDPNFATSTASLISTKISVANTKAYLANTNSYIATKASWTSVTSTNTALRTLISDRYQVANVNTLLAAKATWTGLTGTNTALRTLISDRYQVANVNTLLATKATWTGLTGTNTAIRTLVSDRLQVANASTLYATKSNPTTSGLLAHTGRATISTNLAVTGNTTISGAIIANNSPGTAGHYLRTSGTGIYWSPVSGGGSAANGFSGILVGANVVSADSTTDRLTFVAGSGITIAANPATDTITFTASGGGGSFSGGTISGATTVTDTTASTSNLTGAFKVTGGVGITGNMYTAGRVGYASNTTSGTSAVYTYYNSSTGSLDTVFG